MFDALSICGKLRLIGTWTQRQNGLLNQRRRWEGVGGCWKCPHRCSCYCGRLTTWTGLYYFKLNCKWILNCKVVTFWGDLSRLLVLQRLKTAIIFIYISRNSQRSCCFFGSFFLKIHFSLKQWINVLRHGTLLFEVMKDEYFSFSLASSSFEFEPVAGINATAFFFFFFKGRQVLHRFSPVNLRNLRGYFCIPQFSLHMMCLSPCVYITISNCIKYNVNCGGSISFFFFFCFDR